MNRKGRNTSFIVQNIRLPGQKVGSDYISPLFRTSNLKQGIDENINLKIPVRFADGKVEEYCFNIRLYWQAETPK